MVDKIDTSFWGRFLQSDLTRERQEIRGINQAADELESLSTHASELQREVYKLRTQQQMLVEELGRQRLMIKVLADVLLQAGTVTAEALKYRFEAALLESLPEQPESTAAPTAPKPPARIACVRCGTSVALADSYVTGDGNVCGSCFQSSESPG